MTTSTLSQHNKKDAMDGLLIDISKEPSVQVHKVRPVRLLKSSILSGYNIYHSKTVIRQNVDFGVLSGKYSREAGPEFVQRFMDRFLKLSRLVPQSTMNQYFLERLSSPAGAPFEEVLLEAILAVETAMTWAMRVFDNVAFAKIVDGSQRRHAQLIWECKVPKISRAAAAVGLAGVTELLPAHLYPMRNNSEDFQAAFAALEKLAARRQVPASTAVLVQAAKKRGLPCESRGGPHLVLGHGSALRAIYASATDSTSLAATQLSRHKRKTNRHLAQMRLPVPRHRRVKTPDEALTVAQDLGFPVVLKPAKGKKGGGVSIIKDPKEIPYAFERALGKGTAVIVESFVRGDDHRLLVIGGRFIAALMRLPPTIEGDGRRTIRKLIETLNDDPLRDDYRHFKIPFDDELTRVLEANGCNLETVLEKGKTLALRSTSNVSTGGTAIDVTDRVHPDNQDMAIEAAAAIGLDVAGIDFVTTDISRSYRDIGGGIIEVNARPGLDIHTWPARGMPRDVGSAMLELSFPPGVTGRIPTVVVSGDRGTQRVARDLEVILRRSGTTVGIATPRGAFVGPRPAGFGESKQPNAVRSLLRDARVETLVNTLSPRRLVSRGLMVDHVDVVAIMASSRDDDIEVYRQSLDLLGKATNGALVIGAGNRLALGAMSALDPKRLILVSTDAEDPVVKAHLAAGGSAVVRVWGQGQDGFLVRRHRESVALIPIGPTDSVRTLSPDRVEARMFAIGLAFGLGISGGELIERTKR